MRTLCIYINFLLRFQIVKINSIPIIKNNNIYIIYIIYYYSWLLYIYDRLHAYTNYTYNFCNMKYHVCFIQWWSVMLIYFWFLRITFINGIEIFLVISLLFFSYTRCKKFIIAINIYFVINTFDIKFTFIIHEYSISNKWIFSEYIQYK